jgi:hypothetical protein
VCYLSEGIVEFKPLSKRNYAFYLLGEPFVDTRTNVIIRAASFGKESVGEIRTVHYSLLSRQKRALKTFLALIATALVAVLIPVAHFFLVPILALSAPIAAYLRFSRNHDIEGGSFRCPMCDVEVPIESKKYHARFTENCPACHRSIDIVAEA